MIEQVFPLSNINYVLPPEEKVLVLFVHGLNGGKGSWSKFVTALNNVKEIEGMFDVDYYSYPTSFFETLYKPLPTIQSIADGLRSHINLVCKRYDSIILACHSMGGLICRRYLLNHAKQYKKERFKIKSLLLYAVPNLGSDLNKVNFFNPWHSQIKQLGRNSDFIQDMNSDWNTFGINAITDVKYIIAGRDAVVSKDSAILYWGNTATETDIYKTHFSIIDPSEENDISLLALVNQISKIFNASLGVEDDGYSEKEELIDYNDEETEEDFV